MRSVMARFGFGLLLIPSLIVVAVLITSLWGPLFGIWNWMATAAALLIMAALGLGLIVEFLRPPNPYSRTHPLYDLRDVPKHDRLESASPTMLWQMLPLAVAAVVLFLLS